MKRRKHYTRNCLRAKKIEKYAKNKKIDEALRKNYLDIAAEYHYECDGETKTNKICSCKCHR